MSSKLRKAREESGYTIEEVAQKLNIRRQYIICLETGDLEGIPGTVYVKGYTKMYSEFLGIKVLSTTTKVSITLTKETIENKRIVRKKNTAFCLIVLLIIVILIYYSR